MKLDKDLMMEYKTGNKEALEVIFQRYKTKMLNYAFRLLNNRADAEDVVGEVFYILTTQKDKYEPRAKFSTWLYSIAHNVCINRIRERRRIVFMWFRSESRDGGYEQWDIPDNKDLADTVLERKDASTYVKKAIAKLPFAQKEAILLREYHNLAYDEISDILSCSRAKVKILIFRARKALKKKLTPLLKEGL